MSLVNMDGLDALRVLVALNSGEWDQLQRHQPQECFTDEANEKFAWSIRRGQPPYCDSKGTRVWTGPTPIAVLIEAEKAMEADIKQYKKDNS